MSSAELEILTPVHIGSGETLNPMSYVVQDNIVYFISHDEFLDLLEKKKLTGRFVNYIEKRKYPTMKEFVQEEKEERIDVTEVCERRMPLKGIACKDIRTIVTDGKGRCFIPGSSIKGAVRTALAFQVIQEKMNDQDFWDLLIKGDTENTDIAGVENVRKSKDVGKEIDKIVFRCGKKTKEKGKEKVRYDDAKYDLLKIINFSDFYPEKNVAMEVRNIDTFSFDRQRRLKLVPEGYNTPYEVIVKGTFKGNISIDVNLLSSVSKIASLSEWIGFKERVKALFNISKEVQNFDTTKLKEKILDRIVSSCKSFAQIKLQWINEMIHQKKCRKCGEWVEYSSRALQQYWCRKCGTALSSNQVEFVLPYGFRDFKAAVERIMSYSQNGCILNFGFGMGWISATIGALFDLEIIEMLRKKFKKMEGKSIYYNYCKKHNIKLQKKERNYTYCSQCKRNLLKKEIERKQERLIWPFPKTIRAVLDYSEQDRKFMPASPLGWIKLELEINTTD